MTDVKKNWVDFIGARRVVEHNYDLPKVAKINFDEVAHATKNAFNGEVGLKTKGVAFGRVAAVGAGAYLATGVFRGKDSEGKDRPMLARLSDAVLGVGLMAGGALAGGR